MHNLLKYRHNRNRTVTMVDTTKAITRTMVKAVTTKRTMVSKEVERYGVFWVTLSV